MGKDIRRMNENLSDDEKSENLVLYHNMEFKTLLWSPVKKKTKRPMGFNCDLDQSEKE